MAITNVSNYIGDYTLYAINGVVKIDTPETTLTGNLIVEIDTELRGNVDLGDAPSDEINPLGEFINNLVPQSSATYNIGEEGQTWNELHIEKFVAWGDTSNIVKNTANVANDQIGAGDPNYDWLFEGLYDSKVNREYAALYVEGGVGIEKDLNVGGHIYGRVEFSNTTTFIQVTSTNETVELNLSFVDKEELLGSSLYIDIEGGTEGLTYNPGLGRIRTERVLVESTDASTSISTGALIVEGGAGVAGNLYVGEDIMPETDLLQNIGSSSTTWATAHIHDVYTRLITSTTGTVQIDPAAKVTEIIGDIRVRGTNPIGTAPVVTNILHVTMDGDDTNDGRAQDPSRACRTVTGAVNSPYYQPGTQIRVSPGHYLEDNPIQLKPYTSIMGSDLRTTSIEPINKTQDLFHLNSGCYLAFMQFLNGRSGLLEGQYASGFNRGAYCTAFPPLVGEDRIDLYHSPYIQNCTNLSGPWLKDGTMFVPNQTVQVPLAVGIGTWPKGTSTIVVNAQLGTIERGMTINAGQQNPGFFDARTLMLANKPFLQEQVVAYVDQTFNSGTFVYNTVTCSRDTGLIIDSIALDLVQDSTSESIFAGLQYWSQSGYVDAVGDQISTTTAAINYVKSLAISTATAAASITEGNIVSDRFDDILNILSSGTVGVTDLIISNTATSIDVNIVAAYEALIAAKPTIQADTIDYINSTLSGFTYNQAKCERDTGLIVDAIALDIAFNSTSQSTFAGLQYWNQNGYTGAINIEITTTTNAISYINDLAQKVVLGDTSGTRYQTAVNQNISLTTATIVESTIINDEFTLLLNILNTGTAGVTDVVVSNGITANTSTDVISAYNLLQANKSYLQAEAIAYVESTKTVGFDYDQTKCSRDIGFIVDSISFDVLYGGNKQAIQSGVYYYGFDAGSSAVEGEIPQVLAAYQYIRDLLPSIIRSMSYSGTLYSVESQVFGAPGSTIEVVHAEEKLDIISNIITNGPTVAATPEPISLTRSFESDAIAAAQLLLDNRDFIAAEIIAYTNSLNTFIYDQDKCFRDVGFMIDSVAFDLLHSGNKQSIKSGVYYYNYSDITEIPNEIPQTTAAYNFIRNILPNIVKAQSIISPLQEVTPQDIGLDPGTDYEVAILQSKIDIITDIIRNGPSAVDARLPINLITNESSNFANAYALLLANRDFIRAEVIAYLNTFGTFNYSREFCFRDVGILVENISYDAAFGGNEKAVESGLAYYNGVVSKIAGQEVQTVGAISYLNSLVQQVITNTTCTDLLLAPTYSQVRNTVLTGGAISSDTLKELFDIVNVIITQGPAAAPEIYMGTNADAAFISAEILLQANRKFIQEETISYINNLVQAFPYSERLCRRDTGLIVDSLAFDLLYPTQGYSQSTFAGLQYWNKDTYVGDISVQLDPTVKAVEYLKELSIKIIQNITPADDLVERYQTGTNQVTNLEPATIADAAIISANFDIILEIMGGVTTGWTDRVVPNGDTSIFLNVKNAVALLQANKEYMAQEVTAFVDATNVGFSYDPVKCRRDVGFMTDAVAFDLLHGGNRQSIQTGLYYFGFDSVTSTIRNQEIQTSAAFNYLSSIAQDVVQNIPVSTLQSTVDQVFAANGATAFEAAEIATAISTITNIITNGPTVDYSATAIAMTASSTSTVTAAYELLVSNRSFLVEEVIAYIDQTYNPTSFNYDEALCYRDTGLIVDAVSQDILIGGNFKSIEAGLAYWNYGVSHVGGQEEQTTLALNHAKEVALQVVANRAVDPQTGTIATQVINPFFQYGGDYMPQESIRRNFNIITTIINDGPQYAPPKYMGGGLFALTGINGADVLSAPKVVSVTTITEGKYLVGLDAATIGFGINSTLYFGDTLVSPLRDSQVEEISLEYSGDASTWDGRKTDSIGGMGGSLVDGAVISSRSPIQSFVYDAFTQLTQGGRGVHIRNNGYAQLVSVFTIFASVGVQVDTGGIASIVNSNANFGDVTLLAKGYGSRQFSGQLYNPAFKAYPESIGVDGFNQYYPSGFWPNNAQVAVYVPDTEDRPHISLVMEVIPPKGHENEQGFPGFLNASPTTSTLTTGTISLSDVLTDNVYVGNTVYVRDQYGRTTSTNLDLLGEWIPYVAEGTVVTDVGYNKIVLSKALPSGGGEDGNPNYFDFYFCGPSYYTVLSSDLISNPQYNSKEELIPAGVNILSTASTGGTGTQITAHIAALTYLNTLTNEVITNTTGTRYQTTIEQISAPLVQGGGRASQFIDLRFGEIKSIVNAVNLAAAEAVIKPSLRTTEGPTVAGGGSAISLISQNIEFLTYEVSAYVQDQNPALDFNVDQCQRDVRTILQRLIYDIETGGRYNSVMTGLAYWNRTGTYHRVTLGENVTRTDLFPHNSTVNFYQRSYMSASGYVFEYCGAGTNYGALPQRGVADPVQSREVVQLDSGKVFFTSTDQNGDFRIGPGLVISQATGVLSGRTFTKSLFANMTPFILAIEAGLG